MNSVADYQARFLKALDNGFTPVSVGDVVYVEGNYQSDFMKVTVTKTTKTTITVETYSGRSRSFKWNPSYRKYLELGDSTRDAYRRAHLLTKTTGEATEAHDRHRGEVARVNGAVRAIGSKLSERYNRTSEELATIITELQELQAHLATLENK